MDLTTLASQVAQRRREMDQQLGQARQIQQAGVQVVEQIEALRQTASTMEKAAIVLNSLGEEQQASAQSQIESLVTRGLQTIFGDHLLFHLVQGTRGNAATVDFELHTTKPDGSVVKTSIMDTSGGGLILVIGFLLRLVILLLRNGISRSNVFVLDETFAHVSAEYLERLGEFLREIVDKTGVQIIMVTHQAVFEEYADSVYRFTLGEDKVTKVVQSG